MPKKAQFGGVIQRFVITAVNCVLLIVLLLGVPEVAGVRYWQWQLSSISVARALMFWGLALAAAANAAAALFLVKGRKEREFCLLWAAIFAALFIGEYGYERGWFNFYWLKRALLWATNKL